MYFGAVEKICLERSRSYYSLFTVRDPSAHIGFIRYTTDRIQKVGVHY